MESFKRILDIKKEAYKKSIFLFGPRQTGKTFLLQELFPDSQYYNLLLADVFFHVSQRPQSIREHVLVRGVKEPIIIDEIQKLPLLLDEVHSMIESLGATFILTGSSARKLKRGGANLLGGSARTRHLFPLVFPEIPEYNTERIINFGALPSIYLSDDPVQDLISYCGNYLQEEIAAESAVRRIENFSRFLQMAALSNGELINFTAIASDTAVPIRDIREYFLILNDTFIGKLIEPFKHTKKRKAISTAKFYLFDVGVANTLAGRSYIKPKTELFGKAFEHLIFTEISAFLSYNKYTSDLTFWRDRYDHEVDFIIGDSVAIEVKATESVTEKHCKSLKMLSEETTLKHKIVVSLDPKRRILDGIDIVPYKEFLKSLWEREFI